ncbi:hypothetical protein [Catenibacterium sp.]|uniref:hypothetical protein n=1 Tax=Catenibacterium sp. TaxID=2049022 RepID=UPI003FD80485
MANKLLIVASKRYGDYVKEIAESMECFETISFVDNDREDAIGRLDELSSFCPEYNCAIAACDDGEERLMWNKKLEELFNIPVLFHKDSTISIIKLIAWFYCRTKSSYRVSDNYRFINSSWCRNCYRTILLYR